MPTNAQLAAKLLRDAGVFFRNVGEQNPSIKQELDQNAQVYDEVATLIETDPNAELPTPPEQQG